MSTEQKQKVNVKLWLGRILMLIGTPALLIFFQKFGAKKFYLTSLVVIIVAMVPFFMRFEKKKPQAREIVTLAVLSAIAVASRAAFAMIPHFKPMSGIIMIAGMAFGAESGFLVGAVSAFVSNFIFGQGMWTPWQMFAYGVAGFIAALFYKWGIIGERDKGQKIITPIFGFLGIVGIVGPILDLCSVFTMGNEISVEWALSVFVSGFPVNVIHGAATALTLLFLCRPMMEKLNRIKIKYGMLED